MNKNDDKIFLKTLLKEGLFYLENKKLKSAISKFEKILSYRPDNPQVLNLSGVSYHQLGNFDKAIYLIEKAIKHNSNEIGFYINLGNIFKDKKNYSSSIQAYSNALKINERSSEALYNFGVLYTDMHNFTKAIYYYEQTLKMDKKHKYAHDNLGSAYLELAKYQEAIKCYNKAISIDSNFIQAHFNLSLVLLLTSSAKHGWEEYEYRLKKDNYIKNRPFINYKYWDGSSLDNKSLLIYCEQGIGDNIQFARYIKKIKKNNTKIILLCDNKLQILFKNILEIDLIIISDKNIPKIDYYVSLISLPYIFRREQIPETYKFLKPDKKNSLYWCSKLLTRKKIKIGLVWQGAKTHPEDYKRSIALEKFKPLLELQDIEFISLQKGFGREQIKSNKLEKIIIDFFEGIESFRDTLSIINNLDLVITVDTAIAHIASTMNKKTWIIISHVPDFRWGLKGSKTIWYDNVKLYRQKKINNWNSVINDLEKDLIKKYNIK